MKLNFIIMFLLSVYAIDISAQTDKTLLNRAVDGDLILQINDNGTPTDALTIDGATSSVIIDTKVESQSGSAGAPTYTFSGNSDNGMYSTSTTKLEFSTNAVQRMSLEDSVTLFNAGNADVNWNVGTAGDANSLWVDGGTGYVGLGTNTPGAPFHLQQSEANSNDDGLIVDAAGAGSFRMYLSGTDMRFYKSGIDFMEVDSSGRMLVNTGSIFANGGGGKIQVKGQPGITVNNNSSAASVRDAMVFVDLAEDRNGGVECTATSNTCVYTSVSDKRIKKDFRPIENGLDIVMGMKPSIYKMKNPEDGEKEHMGFVAQELFEVYPEAVSVGGEDALTNPWSVDYGKVTPALAAAIQELANRVADLEERLSAYE